MFSPSNLCDFSIAGHFSDGRPFDPPFYKQGSCQPGLDRFGVTISFVFSVG
jgi:hypothetical protein